MKEMVCRLSLNGPDTDVEIDRTGNERAFIEKLLDELNWNLLKTASVLRVSVARLKQLMHKHGIKRDLPN